MVNGVHLDLPQLFPGYSGTEGEAPVEFFWDEFTDPLFSTEVFYMNRDLPDPSDF